MNLDHLKDIPVQVIYIVVASVGGMARYLNGYIGDKKFSVPILLASAFMAGFSGLMFALVGDSLHLPNPMPHIMAGVGGFFGDQTLKLVLEYVSRNVKSAPDNKPPFKG